MKKCIIFLLWFLACDGLLSPSSYLKSCKYDDKFSMDLIGIHYETKLSFKTILPPMNTKIFVTFVTKKTKSKINLTSPKTCICTDGIAIAHILFCHSHYNNLSRELKFLKNGEWKRLPGGLLIPTLPWQKYSWICRQLGQPPLEKLLFFMGNWYCMVRILNIQKSW